MSEKPNIQTCDCPPGLHPYSTGCLKPEYVGRRLILPNDSPCDCGMKEIDGVMTKFYCSMEHYLDD